MVLCPSGGVPKVDSPAAVSISPAYMDSYLPAALQWLAPFLQYIPPINVNLADFCAVEPLDAPIISFEDLFALVTGNVFSDVALATQKITQVLHRYVWDNYCECGGSDPPPAAYTPPTEPADIPSVNPPGPTPTGVCDYFDGGAHAMTAGNYNTNGGSYYTFPLAATSVRFTFIHTSAGTHSHGDMTFQIRWADENFNTVSGYNINKVVPADSTVQYDVLLPPRAHNVSMEYVVDPTVVLIDDIMQGTASFYCGGFPGVGNQPCGADPISLAKLQEILELVKLIQRQAVPFAYVEGSSHTGLSGSGVLDVQGLIGAKIISTIPGRAGVTAGDPDLVYDIGRVSWGNADGYSTKQYIETTPQLTFPPVAGQYTKLAYTLAPDVTAEIVELVREP